MTIIAMDINGTKFNTMEDVDIIKSKSIKLFCPNCLEELIFVDSVLKIKHFRHYGDNNCSTEPDTEQHILFKKQIHDHYINKGFKCEYEVKIGNRIADLYLEKESLKAVIECQISPISPEELKARDLNYKQLGYNTLWIFHLSNYVKYSGVNGITKSKKKYAVVSLSRVERERESYQNIKISYFDGVDILNFVFGKRVNNWGHDTNVHSKRKFKETTYFKTERLMWLDLTTDNYGRQVDGDKVLERIIKLQPVKDMGETSEDN